MEETATPRSFAGLRLSALTEIVLFFIITTAIAFIFGFNVNYFGISPHPFWLALILISTQYGTMEGVLCAIVCTLVYLFGPTPMRNILQDRYDYFFLLAKEPLLWFVMAVFLGELRNRHRRDKSLLQKEVKEAHAHEESIGAAYSSLKRIKEALELRVASETQSAFSQITAIKDIEQQDVESVLRGGMELIRIIMAPMKFSIFFVENNSLIKAIDQGWQEDDTFSNSFSEESLLYKEVVINNHTFSSQAQSSEEIEKECIIAIPILLKSQNRVIGMIKMEDIPFMRLKTSSIEAIHSIGEWIAKSYNKIKRAEEESAESK